MAGIGHRLYKREKNMHREIQIKQFPIVNTHWWPKTRNERFCVRKRTVFISFFYLLYTTMSKWSECAHASGVCVRSDNEWRIRARDHFQRLRRLTPIHTGRRRQRLSLTLNGVTSSVAELNCGSVASLHWRCSRQKLKTFQLFKRQRRRQPIRSPHANTQSRSLQHQRSMWLVVVTMTARQHHASDHALVKRWRRRPVWMQREPERAHTNVTHRMRVRTQITWTWLCTRGKKRYKYYSFSHTNRSFRVLGHQCVVTMGNCLIGFNFSVHVLFPSYRDSDLYLPLYDWQTRTVWPKNIKIGSTEEKKTLGCPWGKLIDTKF